MKKFNNLLDLENYMNEQENLKRKKLQEGKLQRRHDYLVACFGAVAGAIAGLGASIMFWLLTK